MRSRYDPNTGATFSLTAFRKAMGPQMSAAALMNAFRRYPRKRIADDTYKYCERECSNWGEYVHKYVDKYTMEELITYWSTLQLRVVN